jgi:hypothetical protein
MPQVLVRRPLHKPELPHEHRPQPQCRMPEYAAQSVEKVSVTAFNVVWIGIVRPSSPVRTITNPMDVLTISFVESELDLSVSFRQLCLNQWQCKSGPSAPHPESKVMRRPKRDPAREDRIHNEAIVDAGPEEQAMSWYYYLEGKISSHSGRSVSPRIQSRRSERGKPSRSDRWPWWISASTTCLCRSVGNAARWQSLSRN